MTSPSDAAVATTFGKPARAARFGDRRGLTAAGGVLLNLLIGGAGAAVDLFTGNGLRLVFAVCFAAAAVLTATLVHRADLRAAVVMPPLLYVVLAVLGGTVDPQGATGSVLSRLALGLLNAVVLGAPVLVGATVGALAVVLVRAVRRRQ